MEYTIDEGISYPDQIRELFIEYTKMLVSLDPGFSEYLTIQNFDHEIEDLGYKYGRPEGRLYIVLDGGMAVGCIGLRKMDDDRCEMKRLYVRPEYRRHGIAAKLCAMIIEDAEEIGYKEMYLDTLPGLEAAIKLYEDIGFEITGPYNDSPLDTTIFMKKVLGDKADAEQ